MLITAFAIIPYVVIRRETKFRDEYAADLFAGWHSLPYSPHRLTISMGHEFTAASLAFPLPDQFFLKRTTVTSSQAA
jgi:hypothetical protein